MSHNEEDVKLRCSSWVTKKVQGQADVLRDLDDEEKKMYAGEIKARERKIADWKARLTSTHDLDGWTKLLSELINDAM